MEKIDCLEIKVRRQTALEPHDLASKLGISQTTLSEIERGKLQPSPELLKRILEVLKGEQRGK